MSVTLPRPAGGWRNSAWRLAETVTTPLVPADYLDLFHPLRPGADLRARIVKVIPETPDAATIVMKPGADWEGHKPGQYMRIGIDIEGVRHWRAYSLTHGPREDGLISITVKAVPDGLVSNHLVRRARAGTLVHIAAAEGEFVLPPAGKLLYITAGSGITPVIGMLRNLYPVTDSGVLKLGRSAGYDIVVIHVAPSRPDSIFVRDLEALAEAGAIRLVARYNDRDGGFDVSRLAEAVPDFVDRKTLACGPAGLLDALAEHHAAYGLDVVTERFRTARVEAGEGGVVSFEKTGTDLDLDGSTTILDAAEEAGVLMPSGCRMGICMGCVIPLVEGSVRDLRNGEITTAVPGETEPGGIKVQTCVTAAAGACRLDH
ncbi:ferredoxin reductase [Millisia brevis]|uniref:ferredoxin reductase n=1 Tax=Millisia brevis TaxID=264148 RepID=UPI000836B728|nr:ferredoxin reductase [Millisia brevis]